MKISVVIPNFNGSKLLKDNLPKILAAVKDSQVIVVDDDSTDDSISLLKINFPQVNVIARKKNEGFASSVNDGVKKASGDLILLLNTDVVPQGDFVKYLLPHFSDPQVFAVGCLQNSNNSGVIKKEGRGIGKFEKGFLIHGPGSLTKNNSLWVFGGAGMFRKKIWEKLGGMDTIYNPFYWEDIDLSYRALKAGYKLVFEHKSVVMHNQEQGTIRNLYTSGQVKTIAYRNQILFVWLNITDFPWVLNHLIYLPRQILKALFSLNRAFLGGFILAILKFPYVLSIRSRNRKQSLMSDEKILADLSQ